MANLGRLGGAAIATALLLALTAPAVGAPDDRYFKYVKEFPFQWIRGRVVDNLGAGIENASAVRILENGDVFLTFTDENGNFAIFTPVEENTRYRLIINENHTGFNGGHPHKGFRSCVIENWIDNSGSRYHLVVLDYDPFDASFSAGSDLKAKWSQVVKERRHEYRLFNTIHGSKYKVRLVGGHRIYTNQTTTDPNYRVIEHVPGGYCWGGDYDYRTGAWISPSEYLNREFTASSGSEIGLHRALRNVRYRVGRVVYDSYYKVYQAGYWTFGGFRIYYIPGPYYIHFCDFYVGGSAGWIHGLSVPPQTFSITESESRELRDLTYYANNGSFVRIDSLDYVMVTPEPVEIRVLLAPKNGYSGSVRLVAESDKLSVFPRENVIDLSSGPVSTAIKVSMRENVKSGSYGVLIRAYDSGGNLIHSDNVPVTVVVPPKPSPMTVEYLLWSPGNRIDVQVLSAYGGCIKGARVVLRYRLNGAVFASGYTDNNGIFSVSPSEWPLNTNLDAEVSYPGYITRHATVHTEKGGVRCVSVYLDCGDYKLEGYGMGSAKVDQYGNIRFNSPGSVRAYVEWPAPAWTGGPVSLSGRVMFPEYFSGYEIKKSQLDPALNPDVSLVVAYPRKPVVTSSAVEVTSRAGAPTYFWDIAHVGYTVELAPLR